MSVYNVKVRDECICVPAISACNFSLNEHVYYQIILKKEMHEHILLMKTYSLGTETKH